jgi:NADH-quinone oxidoreductase subunit G
MACAGQAEARLASHRLLASPHSTVEELALAGALVRGLGSDNIDTRLRAADFSHAARRAARWLGLPIAELVPLSVCWWWVPTCARTIPCLLSAFARRLAKAPGQCAGSRQPDWAMPVRHTVLADAAHWVWHWPAWPLPWPKQQVACKRPPCRCLPTAARAVAKSLLSGERKAMLLGNAAAHHEQAASLLALANWIAQQTGARVGYLTEAANTVGAQLVGAVTPGRGVSMPVKCWVVVSRRLLLLNMEPGKRHGRRCRQGLPGRHGGHAQPVQDQHST